MKYFANQKEIARAKTYPGVIISTVLNGNTGLAESSWHVIALSVRPVFTNLSLVQWGVVIIFSGNNDVVGFTISDDGFLIITKLQLVKDSTDITGDVQNYRIQNDTYFLRVENVSLGNVNLWQVQLKSGGNTWVLKLMRLG